MEPREWTCELVCVNKNSTTTSVTVKVENLNDHFYRVDDLVIMIKDTSIFFGGVGLRKIYDRVGDQEIIHYSRNSPRHMSRELYDLLKERVKPIYVI